MKIFKKLINLKSGKKRYSADDAENSPKLKKLEEKFQEFYPDFKIHVVATGMYSFYYDYEFTNQNGYKQSTKGSTPKLKSLNDVNVDMNTWMKAFHR